jgi:predicted DNA-binding transcriptional regulator AlpA
MRKQPTPGTDKWIGTMEVAAKLNCHPASIDRLVKQKRLPPPIKLLNKNQWRESQIDQQVENGLPPPPRA